MQVTFLIAAEGRVVVRQFRIRKAAHKSHWGNARLIPVQLANLGHDLGHLAGGVIIDQSRINICTVGAYAVAQNQKGTQQAHHSAARTAGHRKQLRPAKKDHR